MKKMSRRPKLDKARTWGDLWTRANSEGPLAERWQQVIIGATRNLACEGFAENYKNKNEPVEWKRHYSALYDFMASMVGEYGQSEDEAEKGVLAEVNHIRSLY